MTCFLCTQPITARQKVEYHHPIYKSRGGKKTAPTHKRCHRIHHSGKGDFRERAKMGTASKKWAFNLKNVRTHPAYEQVRWSYLMNSGLGRMGRRATLNRPAGSKESIRQRSLHTLLPLYKGMQVQFPPCASVDAFVWVRSSSN